jgi:hypothetical protein
MDDTSLGSILTVLTEYDAFQAQSLLNYVIEKVDINTLNPISDSLDPIIYFYSTVGASASGDYIAFWIYGKFTI